MLIKGNWLFTDTRDLFAELLNLFADLKNFDWILVPVDLDTKNTGLNQRSTVWNITNI